MKIKITNTAFVEANAAMKPLVGKDSTGIFSNVRLDSIGHAVSLTGTNGDIQLEWRIKEEAIESADVGVATVSGARLAAFASAMPSGIVTVEDVAEDKIKVEGAGVTFRLATGDAADYPAMIGPKPGTAIVVLRGVTLRELIRKVRFAVSTDKTRAIMCGVNIKADGRKLEMTATDGRRLAHIDFDVDAEGANFDVTITSKTVAVLYGLLEKCVDEDATIAADGAAIRIMCGNWCLTAKVIDGVYPLWKKVVPGKPAHKVAIGRAAFLEGLQRAALATVGDDCANVKVELRKDVVMFEARSEFTWAQVVGPAVKDAEKMSWRFDPRLLRDVLEAIDEDEFELGYGWGGAAGPVLIKCSVPWLAVLMPLQIK